MARNKLLEQRANKGIYEEELEIQSKTIYRNIPPKPLISQEVMDEIVQPAVDPDVSVVKNTKAVGCDIDVLIGGIYGWNGLDVQ